MSYNHNDSNTCVFNVPCSKLTREKETYYDDGSDRAFREYDSRKNNPYPVYRNDIKFKKLRNIDPKRAVWHDDVKNDYYTKDTDSIDYRIEECIREKSEMIDLSHMDENCLVALFSHKLFPSIRGKIQHLFAKDCGLREIPKLDCLISLLTLDLSCNKLKSLPDLPTSLEELIINDNRIAEINNELPHLLRFNGDDNIISKFNYPKNIERIHLKGNPISYIIRLDALYFLDIAKTNIIQLYPLPNLKYLDVSFTNVKTLPMMDSLQVLVCNDSTLMDITSLKNLHTLDMVRSKVVYIPYFKDLQKIVYERGDVFGISKQYAGKLKHIKHNRNNIIETTFK